MPAPTHRPPAVSRAEGRLFLACSRAARELVELGRPAEPAASDVLDLVVRLAGPLPSPESVASAFVAVASASPVESVGSIGEALHDVLSLGPRALEGLVRIAGRAVGLVPPGPAPDPRPAESPRPPRPAPPPRAIPPETRRRPPAGVRLHGCGLWYANVGPMVNGRSKPVYAPRSVQTEDEAWRWLDGLPSSGFRRPEVDRPSPRRMA